MDLDTSVGAQRLALIQQWNETQRWKQANDLNPDPEVQVEELPTDATHRRVEMLSRAQGTAPVDVYSLDVPLTAEFVMAGYLAPMDTNRIATRDFLAKPLDTCKHGGQLWALPFNTDVGLLFYNRQLVGNPTTRDWAVTDIDRVLAGLPEADTNAGQASDHSGEQTGEQSGEQSGDGDGVVDPYIGQFADNEGFSVNVLEALNPTVDDEHQVHISPDNYDRLRRLVAWLGTPEQRARALSYDETASRQRFATGKAAFMRNWPVAYRKLKDQTTEGDHLAFGVSLLPGGAVLGGQNLAISNRSTQPAAAQRLVEFLTSPASQQRLFEQGGFAATIISVYQDSRITAKYGRELLDTLLRAIQDAHPRPEEQYYEHFSQVLRTQLRPAWFSAQQAVELPDRSALERTLTRALRTPGP